MSYGTHSSALKEKNFAWKELMEQLQAGHVVIFPWEAFKHLPGLWLLPLVKIPQTGRKPQIIYDFLWSGLNKKAHRGDPKEAIRVGRALHRLLDYILAVYLEL